MILPSSPERSLQGGGRQLLGGRYAGGCRLCMHVLCVGSVCFGVSVGMDAVVWSVHSHMCQWVHMCVPCGCVVQMPTWKGLRGRLCVCVSASGACMSPCAFLGMRHCHGRACVQIYGSKHTHTHVCWGVCMHTRGMSVRLCVCMTTLMYKKLFSVPLFSQGMLGHQRIRHCGPHPLPSRTLLFDTLKIRAKPRTFWPSGLLIV